ncbi:hypothetical protein GS398_08205 [Pedobacter sp. HMF7056]|uniref:Uncharacterized protein n=2 Tax=Hufsiella ginkgonis TaxID=2695274 RepID=A0A7K1XWD1_9SPHI|nr:hypothetical protein [Hufsiella ginkgonis]
MFYDDLEKVLEKQSRQPLDILKPKDKRQMDQLIGDYVRKHLEITVDGKKAELTYLGYEIQEDGAWSYFEAKQVNTAKKITVMDNLLFEQHPEQINMMHVTVSGLRKSTKLDNPEAIANFSF